jgi:hypothetical protein
MGPVILDDVLRAKLNGLVEPVPVIEPTGETVGHFVPEELYVALLYKLAREAVTTEELDQAAREPDGRRLAEIHRDRLVDQ